MTNWQAQVDRVLGVALSKFGESVTFLPPSPASSFTGKGIFTAAHKEVDPNAGAVISTNEPVLGVRLSDFATIPDNSWRVTVREVTYRVVDRQDDGEGGATLFLQKV
mgnify:CR=1 FL=1